MTLSESTQRTLLIPSSDLLKAITQFGGARVLIIGDAMLDEYLTGDADRISPEAPVPVVRVDSQRHLVGGAGNVARNVTKLGGHAVLIGVCGEDAAGRNLMGCLERDGISHALLRLNERPTTIKTRILARQQQVLRIDREDSSPLSEAQIATLLDMAESELPSCGAVVLSDYGKGTVTEQLVHGLLALTQKKGRRVPILVDPKPQNFKLYKEVTLLTPNAKETSESVNMPVKSSQDVINAGREILRQLQCEHLVTTLGSRGMAVFESKDIIWHIPTMAREVFDVTGAGDTVIATMALGASIQLPLLPSCLLANYAAGIVVAEVGAAAASPVSLAAAIKTLPEPLIAGWA